MARAVGIDLGTTNSCIALLKVASPPLSSTLKARAPRRLWCFSKSGEILVGEVAKRQAVTNVDRTISSVKRHMGSDWDRRHRRQEVDPAGDFRADPDEAEEGC